MKKNLLRYVNIAIKENILKVDFLIAAGRGKVTVLLSSICYYISSCIFRLKTSYFKSDRGNLKDNI